MTEVLAQRIDVASFLMMTGQEKAIAVSTDRFNPDLSDSNDNEFRKYHDER